MGAGFGGCGDERSGEGGFRRKSGMGGIEKIKLTGLGPKSLQKSVRGAAFQLKRAVPLLVQRSE